MIVISYCKSVTCMVAITSCGEGSVTYSVTELYYKVILPPAVIMIVGL